MGEKKDKGAESKRIADIKYESDGSFHLKASEVILSAKFQDDLKEMKTILRSANRKVCHA